MLTVVLQKIRHETDVGAKLFILMHSVGFESTRASAQRILSPTP